MNVKTLSFEQVEEMKRAWTEKYVQVDDGRPELKRFAGRTGRVITVNMSGRALVQFDDADGWGWGRYDIALPFLRQVAAPVKEKAEKHEGKKEPAAAAGAAGAEKKPVGKMSPIEMMRAKAAAKAGGTQDAPAVTPPAEPKPAGKMSPIEMMRAKAAAKAAGTQDAPAETPPAEPKPAGKMSPIEIMRAKAAAKAAESTESKTETTEKTEAKSAETSPGKMSPIEMIRAKAKKKADEKPDQ